MPYELDVIETYFVIGEYTKALMEFCKADPYRECPTCPRKNLCHLLVKLQVDFFDDIMKGKF